MLVLLWFQKFLGFRPKRCQCLRVADAARLKLLVRKCLGKTEDAVGCSLDRQQADSVGTVAVFRNVHNRGLLWGHLAFQEVQFVLLTVCFSGSI